MQNRRCRFGERSAPIRRALTRHVLGFGGALLLVLAGCANDDPESRVPMVDVPATGPGAVAATFREVDRDGDNRLSRDEVSRWWRGRTDEREFAATPRERTYLDAWDLNHDSRYDDDEVVDGFFDAFDANRDDRIGRDEWEAANRDVGWVGL